jgi:hypothetical protein
MAEADWTTATASLDAGSVKRGATTGEPRPNGGGNFVFGFNSIVNTLGAIAMYATQAGFAPMPKGASIRGAMKRGVSGGPTNFAPFLFAGLASNTIDIGVKAYLLGLDDDDPHRIAVVKGSPLGGIPPLPPPQSGVLMQGTETFLNNTWLHLRLDMIVNLNGDVILQAYRSDLAVNPVSAPVWVPVPGCENFVDDALAVNSGSAPLTSGYGGFGFQTKDVTRRAFFDRLEVQQQL